MFSDFKENPFNMKDIKSSLPLSESKSEDFSMREMRDALENSNTFSVGTLVERVIDGIWFVAKVEFFDDFNRELRLRYTDDDNVEERVPVEDVRLAPDNANLHRDNQYSNNINNNDYDNFSSPVEFSNDKSIYDNDTLLKPLKGLIDDDANIRRAHRPTVIMHSNTDSEGAIILNGAENRLAAGGGLRALRYLRKGEDGKDAK